MIDTQNLVAVYTVKNAQHAEIVKNFLHSEGIACRIDGEGQLGLTGILDISLLVHAEDADRARKLVLQHEDAGRGMGRPPDRAAGHSTEDERHE